MTDVILDDEALYMARNNRVKLLAEHLDKIQTQISALLDKEDLTLEDVQKLQLYCQSLRDLSVSADDINNTPY